MPGIFGYHDPRGLLAADARERMARALGGDGSCTVAYASGGATHCGLCVGVVDRGVFPGADRVHVAPGGARQVVLQGAILGAGDNDDAFDRNQAVARCFAAPLDDALLARTAGSFAAAILDAEGGTIECVTDRHGALPLYWFSDGAVTLFASQQKALLATGYFTPRIDPLAVATLLQIGLVCGEHTLLEGVRVVPPASRLRIDAGGVDVRRYHRLVFSPDPHADWDETVTRLGSLLRRAVKRTVLAGVATGVPVSGGLDSRTILALTPEPAALPTFTFGPPHCRDRRFGAALARALGCAHHGYDIDEAYLADHLETGVWLSEGLLGANHFHILPHVPRFAEHCALVLDGIGGDVILGGKYVKPKWAEASSGDDAQRALWSWLATVLPEGSAGQAASAQVGADAFAEAPAAFARLFDACPGATPQDRVMPFALEHRTRRVIGCGMDLLRWRVEALHPFFDNDFVDAVARVPHAWRKRSRLHLAILREGAPRAARVRWQHTGLPASAPFRVSWSAMAAQRGLDLAGRRLGVKTFFPNREMSDFGAWFRGPLRGLVEGVLLDERTCARGVVSADLVRSAVREHGSGEADRSMLIGVLLSLETFCRMYLDDFDAMLQARTVPPIAREDASCNT